MSTFRMSLLSMPRAVARSGPIHTARSFSTSAFRWESQGYGDGKGDPRGENPQEQGSSNPIKHAAEHPGPEPPAEGQGTGGGPTKAGSSPKTPEDASAQSGGSRSKEAKETGKSPTGGKLGGGNQGGRDQGKASTPILKQKLAEVEVSPEKQAEIEEHNRDFEKGHDRVPRAES